MDNQEPQLNTQPPKNNAKLKHIGVVVYLIVVVLAIIAVAVIHNHDHKTNSSNNNVSAISAANVSITPSGLVPQAITVSLGQAVTWTNNDKSEHQIASDPYPKDNTLLSLNSKSPIMPGHTYSYVFNKAGTYTYHDNLNPYTIKGTVIVK